MKLNRFTNKQQNKQMSLLGETRNLHTGRMNSFYKNGKVKIQTYSASTQECLKKSLSGAHKLEYCIIKQNTQIRMSSCVVVFRDPWYILVAGDICEKPKDLRHVPRTSFLNSCHLSEEAMYVAVEKFIIVRNVKV